MLVQTRRYTVAELIPHAGRMVLLDEILDYDKDRLTAALTLRDDSLFLDSAGRVPIWVGIEYMAQTIAAWAGVQAKNCGEPVRTGYLLGTRRYRSCATAFEKGDYLQVRAVNAYFGNDVGVFDCEIIRVQTVLVSAALNVYQPNLENANREQNK